MYRPQYVEKKYLCLGTARALGRSYEWGLYLEQHNRDQAVLTYV